MPEHMPLAAQSHQAGERLSGVEHDGSNHRMSAVAGFPLPQFLGIHVETSGVIEIARLQYTASISERKASAPELVAISALMLCFSVGIWHFAAFVC